MPPTTIQELVSIFMQEAALNAEVMTGFVEVAPALEIVTPAPCVIESVPVAPVLTIFTTLPVVIATLLFGGMVMVTVPVVE